MGRIKHRLGLDMAGRPPSSCKSTTHATPMSRHLTKIQRILLAEGVERLRPKIRALGVPENEDSP